MRVFCRSLDERFPTCTSMFLVVIYQDFIWFPIFPFFQKESEISARRGHAAAIEKEREWNEEFHKGELLSCWLYFKSKMTVFIGAVWLRFLRQLLFDGRFERLFISVCSMWIRRSNILILSFGFDTAEGVPRFDSFDHFIIWSLRKSNYNRN